MQTRPDGNTSASETELALDIRRPMLQAPASHRPSWGVVVEVADDDGGVLAQGAAFESDLAHRAQQVLGGRWLQLGRLTSARGAPWPVVARLYGDILTAACREHGSDLSFVTATGMVHAEMLQRVFGEFYRPGNEVLGIPRRRAVCGLAAGELRRSWLENHIGLIEDAGAAAERAASFAVQIRQPSSDLWWDT